MFYFLYGIISALFAVMVTFNHLAPEILDDYYIELLNNEYFHIWKYTNLTIASIFIICCIIWIYCQGMDAAKEISKQIEEEPLINKSNE